MKFINKGKKSIEVRTGERFNHSWTNVRPGETINLPERKGKRYGFEKVNGAQELPEVTEGKIGKTKVETKQFDEPNFYGKLCSIKGIALKTAKDIIKVFPTEEKLRHAISHDDELPFRDDIEKKLRKEYGK